MIEILSRDLAKRSLTEILPIGLLHRDLAKRARIDFRRDLKRPLIGSLYRDLAKRPLVEILYRDIA